MRGLFDGNTRVDRLHNQTKKGFNCVFQYTNTAICLNDIIFLVVKC